MSIRTELSNSLGKERTYAKQIYQLMAMVQQREELLTKAEQQICWLWCLVAVLAALLGGVCVRAFA